MFPPALLPEANGESLLLPAEEAPNPIPDLAPPDFPFEGFFFFFAPSDEI
jgi:hypothetical protein